jgi:dihydrofolate reductase
MSKPIVSLVVAVAQNGVIGRGGDLPWRLSGDLARFKRLTMGHPLVMGRKTFDSIGRALPGRLSIVLTRDPDKVALQERVVTAPGWDEAIAAATAQTEFDPSHIFVIGGGEIFRLAWPHASRLYRTVVDAELDGDTFLKGIDLAGWELTEAVEYPADEQNEFGVWWEVWERRETFKREMGG